jgi:hypothetical protein
MRIPPVRRWSGFLVVQIEIAIGIGSLLQTCSETDAGGEMAARRVSGVEARPSGISGQKDVSE